VDQKIINWQWPNPHIQKIKVLSEHTDRLGHTNNVRYLEWLEAIAWDHIESLGCGWETMEKLGKAMAIIRTEIDYRAASYESNELLLGTWVTSSDKRFLCERHFQLFRTSDAKIILDAKMVFACIVLKSGQPTKMPNEFITALEKGLKLNQATISQQKQKKEPLL